MSFAPFGALFMGLLLLWIGLALLSAARHIMYIDPEEATHGPTNDVILFCGVFGAVFTFILGGPTAAISLATILHMIATLSGVLPQVPTP